MSNVHGLFSNKNKDEEDNDDDDDNNRYVGGIGARGGGSGLAVLPNPNELDGNTNAAQRDMVFGLAQEAAGSAGEEDNDDQIRRTITMYQNGFIVDDGPYRRLDDPANADFLRSLAMGRTPRELMDDTSMGGNNIVVGLIDKRSEDYVEPFRSFSGAGATLGSSATSATSTEGVFDPQALPPPPADGVTGATTNVAVRLPNGKRKVVPISLNATVHDLAIQLRDDADGTPFRLVAGFPPQTLTDAASTIEAAGLKGAQISMHKV